MQILSSRWAIPALFLVFALRSSAQAGEDKKEKPDEPRSTILDRLRQLCVADAELHGVFIAKDGKEATKGALLLKGFVDSKDQLKLFTERANALIAGVDAWRKAYPAGVDAGRLTLLPVRSRLLPKIRADFAGLPWPDETKELLTCTRLDDVYYDGDALRFTGVCIAKGADAKKDEPAAAIQATITKLLSDYGAEELAPFKIDVAKVAVLKNPLPEFQEKFTRTLNVDHVLFRDARYAADGALELAGFVDAEIAADLPKLFTTAFADHPALGKPRVVFDKMKPIAWPLALRAWNRRLNLSPDHLRTCVYRAYPHYFGDFLGIQCEAYYDNASDEKKYELLLRERLDEEIGKDWPALRELIKGNVVVVLRNQGDLREKLQDEIVKLLRLPQLVLEDVHYNPDATLEIAGLAADEKDRAALQKHLEEKIGRAWPKRRWSLEQVRIEDWPAKLQSIQQKLVLGPSPLGAQTRLDKIFFDYSGAGFLEYRFAGITFQDLDKDKATEFLVAEVNRLWPRLRDHKVIRDLLSIEGIQAIPSPAPLLQEKAADVPALDGVFIEKAGFDADGKLTLSGVWRGTGQDKALLELIAAVYKGNPLRPDAKGVVLLGLKPLETDKLLEQLQKFAAEQMEDVQVRRLYFDKDGKLHLRATVREENAKSDERKLKDELERLKRFLPGGKSIKIADEPVKKAGIGCHAHGFAWAWEASEGASSVLAVQHAHAKPWAWHSVAADLAARRAYAATLAMIMLFPPDGDDIEALPSLTRHVREKIVTPADPYSDGVLIERGYFDGAGRYHLRGLVDNLKQLDALSDALKKLAKEPAFAAALKLPPDLTGLKVLPLAPMLDALGVLMPDYDEFDFLRIDRVYHVYVSADDKLLKKLEFTLFSAEAADKLEARLAKAKDLLQALLLAHPDWHARVGDGVTLKALPVETDAAAARAALAKAQELLVDHLPTSFTSLEDGGGPVWTIIGCTPVLLLPARTPHSETPMPKPIPEAVLKRAIKYLDTAILHFPDDSSAWFLRGSSYLALGAPKLAARDLRRVNRIEFSDATARTDRLRALTLFQGPLRLATSDLAAEERILAAGGRRMLSLREASAVVRK